MRLCYRMVNTSARFYNIQFENQLSDVQTDVFNSSSNYPLCFKHKAVTNNIFKVKFKVQKDLTRTEIPKNK